MTSRNNSSHALSITGRGKGKSSTPQNSPNSIRTLGWVRYVEVISEGPIEGLVDKVNGGKSIYFDQTPLLAPDGMSNFANVAWEFHNGTPDDGYLNGATAVETPFDVSVQVKHNAVPVSRTIMEENADAVRVILRVNALFSQNDKGEMHGTGLHYSIEVRGNGGTWQQAVSNSIWEKSTSPFQIAHRVDLPLGGSPWEIRVIRHTPDKSTTDDKLQNDLYFERYITLVEGKFTYPHTALIGVEANAEDLGSSVPPRAYHVKGLKIQVPSNYNPVLREYKGIWDGTFKIAWTNNPAWIFYDLITNDRYGLGEFISANIVDKWSLYTIAQYCDQSVPSGYKNGDTGEMIYEPRFTFNGVINSRDEAYFVLQTITKAWRGMAYWALGQVFATADIPSDPIKLVTPANVIKGEFEYSGTALKARHSVIMVKWNDPKDFYAPATEAVIDDQLLAKYGWREKSLQLQGCTSRGLAHRYGKWILDSEQHETETVTYQAGWDHADVRPGHLIAISDPNKANIRAGGRIKNHQDLTVVLDADFEATTGEQYQLILTMPDGTLETKKIAAFATPNTVILNEAFSQIAVDNAVWTIKGTDIHPRIFRVLAVKEEEPNILSITALFHDPQKYDRIEQGIVFEPLPYDRPDKLSQPPTNLSVKETGYTSNGQSYQILTVSWSPPETTVVRSYIVSVDTPAGDHIVLGVTQDLYKEFTNTETGTYKFYVETVSHAGVISQPAEIEYEAQGGSGYPLPTITDLQLVDDPDTTEFTGRDLRFRWTNNFAQSMTGIPTSDPSPHYLANTLKIYNNQTNQLLRELKVTNNIYAYYYEANEADNIAVGNEHACRQLRVEVVVHDVFGRTSNPAITIFNNPPPLAIAPTPLVNGSTIYLHYDEPLDTDFAGVVVYRSETAGIDVTTDAPYYDGTANPVIVLGEEGKAYYLKIAGYDAFGKEGLNYSSEFIVTTLLNADTTPPATPTGLAAASTMVNGAPRVAVWWDANQEADLAGYDLRIQEGEGAQLGNWVSFTATHNIHEFDGKPGIAYNIIVRARDKAGNTSAYTNIFKHMAVKDYIPPAKPTNLIATPGFGTVWLNWDKNTEYDLSHYVIHENINGDYKQYYVASNAFVRSGLAGNQLCFFQVQAVDTSGNESYGSDSVSVTTASPSGVTADDLQGLITNTSFAEGLTGIEVLSALPTTGNKEGRMVLNTTDGKLYRFINGAWTVSTAAQDITGKLTAGQIAAGAIGAEQIAANAIAAKHLTIGDFTNLIDKGWATGDISGWDIDGNYELPTPAINADYYGYTIGATGRVAAISNSVPVKSGEVYYYGVWVNNTDEDYAAYIGIGAVQPDDNIIWADVVSTNVADEWVYLSGQYTVPNDVKNIFVYLFTDRPWGEVGDTTYWSKPLLRRAMSGELIVDGAIKANHLSTEELITSSAQIKDAIITNAKIVELDAAKIKANTVLAGSIKVGGDTLDSIKDNASNPASQINTGSTLIDPGKILISGATSLADWRMGGDTTKIDGGHIAANTISANKLTIGSRGIVTDLIEFETNKPSPNYVSWTDGIIHYIDDDGSAQQAAVWPGSTAWSLSNPVYIYWQKGGTNLQTTIDFAIANQPNNVILAVYRGDDWLDANYGRTIIEGNQIKTGSITANQIKVGAIAANQIAADAIAAQHISANAIITDKIAANAVTADKIVAGAITADKIAAGAITTDTLAAGSIHGSVIQAGTLDAGAIAAGTITADKIMANTVTANNLEPSAITQVVTGSGQSFNLGFYIQTGYVLIMAHAWGSGSINSGQSGSLHMYVHVYRNGVYIASAPLVAVTTKKETEHTATTTTTYNGTLLLTDAPPVGWQNYGFWIDKGNHIYGSNVSAVIMNYKR